MAAKAAVNGMSAASATPAKKSSRAKQAMQVSVVVRVRPLLAQERSQQVAVRVTRAEKRNQPSLVVLSPREGSAEPSAEFAFDKCYDGSTPQRLLFQREIAQSVTGVLAGVNTTVFAYGATGAGKTFTMEGSKKNLGMIPRCVKQLFYITEESKCNFQVDLSYLEIYNDRILDLLVAKAQKADLPIRQQVDGSISVHGLTKKRITTLQEFEELYEKGSAGRKKARTELNPVSSRSHSILMLHVTTTDEASGEVRNGKLHLIDLAGCEDNRKTGNSGARLAESGKINMSLFVLGKVITALNSGDIQRIPFRDSKLTRLLQDSLGGSSHAVMICNVSPVVSMYQETLQTLMYAFKARGIVNDVAINRSSDPKTASVPAPATITKSIGTAVAMTARGESRRANLSPKTPSSAPKVFSEPVARPTNALKSHATPLATRQGVGSSLAMESKLAAWRESKNNNSRSSTDVKNTTNAGALGLKRKAMTSIGEPKLTPTPFIPAGASSWSKAAVNHSSKPVSSVSSATTTATASAKVATSIPAPKKPRLSLAPTESSSGMARTPIREIVKNVPLSSVSKELPKKSPIRSGSPASDKENQPVPTAAANVINEDEKPVLIAKKLIGLAIDMEKKRRFCSAFCLFQRAYHVLPAENVKLVERMKLLLEGECPEAATFVPSQQMATSAYVRVVMERDLLEILNSGSNDELLELHSIGDKRAEKIVEARPFSQLSDLLRVQGITDKVLQKLHAQHTAWENPV